MPYSAGQGREAVDAEAVALALDKGVVEAPAGQARDTDARMDTTQMTRFRRGRDTTQMTRFALDKGVVEAPAAARRGESKRWAAATAMTRPRDTTRRRRAGPPLE